jgi:hypothetical protein
MKTNELVGAALDWAVAEAEGFFKNDMARITDGKVDVFYFDGYAPSIDWQQGGAIIERERITVIAMPKGSWATSTPLHTFHQPTPLIAAMRCYVASKLGDEVEVPTELTQGE